MSYTYEQILDRDAELTAFKILCIRRPNDTIAQVIDDFDFLYINVLKQHASLIVIGHDARRYPHRIPKL